MADGKGDSTHRDVRFTAGVPAVLRYQGAEYPCEAHNLSRSGTLLRGEIPRPEDSVVEFTIRYPHGNIVLDLRGSVVRTYDDADGEGICLGLKFLEISDQDRRLLETVIARVVEGHTPAPLERLRPGAPSHEVRKVLESIPLPHRIALAARATPQERAYLREDKNPKVLESLVRNPNLLQAEARAIAGSIHLLPSTLELLVSDQRWKQDLELRILVATHKRTPLALAEKLVQGMKPQELKKVIQRPGLHQTLRTRITRTLARGS